MATEKDTWAALGQIPAERLAKAAAFYDDYPTGQYDEEAALALRAIVYLRMADQRAINRLRDAAT